MCICEKPPLQDFQLVVAVHTTKQAVGQESLPLSAYLFDYINKLVGLVVGNSSVDGRSQ